MTVIAIANQKGGCGKTTTAINLAACLGRRNQRTLLIDMDPQGHASLGLGQHCQDIPGLYEVFMAESPLTEVIIPDAAINVDLVPATISLAAVEHLLDDVTHRERQLAIHLEPARNDYDYIVIDCPPALSLLSFNALRAADEVLIPVEPGSFSLDGLDRLTETISLLSKKYALDIPQRIIATMVDYRTRFTRQMIDELRARFPEQVLATVIHATVRLREAAWQGKPIIDFCAHSPAAYDYEQLAEELLIETGKAAWGDGDSLASAAQHATPALPQDQAAPRAAGPAARDRSDPALPPGEQPRRVVLYFEAAADQDIKLAGDFNNWVPDQGVRTHRANGIIRKELPLDPGIYQYRLVIDGKWQEDPGNPLQVVNDFGEINSLLQVAAQTEPEEAL